MKTVSRLGILLLEYFRPNHGSQPFLPPPTRLLRYLTRCRDALKVGMLERCQSDGNPFGIHRVWHRELIISTGESGLVSFIWGLLLGKQLMNHEDISLILLTIFLPLLSIQKPEI